MISETEYMAALRIVVDYHQQVGLAGVLARKTIFELQPGDRVKCIKLKRGDMAGSLTIGRSYTITSREGGFFMVRDDKDRPKKYELNAEYWALPK